MNAPTFVILLAVIAVVVLAIRSMHKDKKSGKTCSGCGGGCSGCHSSCGTAGKKGEIIQGYQKRGVDTASLVDKINTYKRRKKTMGNPLKSTEILAVRRRSSSRPFCQKQNGAEGMCQWNSRGNADEGSNGSRPSEYEGRGTGYL